MVEIAFLPAAHLFFQGVDLFRHGQLIEFLSQCDQPFENVGFVAFFKLGISVTGFHDDDDSQKAIVVYRAGRIDDWRSRFRPLQRNS